MSALPNSHESTIFDFAIFNLPLCKRLSVTSVSLTLKHILKQLSLQFSLRQLILRSCFFQTYQLCFHPFLVCLRNFSFYVPCHPLNALFLIDYPRPLLLLHYLPCILRKPCIIVHPLLLITVFNFCFLNFNHFFSVLIPS